MPIYDYVCTSCGHRFEVLRGLNESGPHVCPECGGPVNRAFAPPTIVFKGSGWAKVDRRYAGAPTKKDGTKGSDRASSPGEPAGKSSGGERGEGPGGDSRGSDAGSGPGAASKGERSVRIGLAGGVRVPGLRPRR